MTITAGILRRGDLDTVRLTLTGLPVGQRFEVVGEADGLTWTAGSGKTTDSTVVIADPLAPLGHDAVYTLRVNGITQTSAPVRRTFKGYDVITDLSGRAVVPFIRPHNDSRSYGPRATFFDVPGRAIAPAIYAPVAEAPSGDFEARVAGREALRTLDALVMANRPVVVLHNRCPLPECDVTPASLVFMESVSSDLSSRKAMAERIFRIGYRPVPQAYDHRPPVVTVADVIEQFDSLADVKAVASIRALLEGDWSA